MKKNLLPISLTAFTLVLAVVFSYIGQVSLFDLLDTQASVVVSQYKRSPTEKTISVKACSDTDNGIYYNVPGTATLDLGKGKTESATDACMSDTVLRENWCMRSSRGKSYIEATDITCKYGCSNARCGNAPIPVTAKVVDAATKKPVSDVAVILIGRESFYDRAFTDVNGQVKLNEISNYGQEQRKIISDYKVSAIALKKIGSTWYQSKPKLIKPNTAKSTDIGTLELEKISNSNPLAIPAAKEADLIFITSPAVKK